MSKRVYHLKHATPRMKYIHMRNMMEFKADLKENQVNPPDRHIALADIKDLMGSADFNTWYDKVYELRRRELHAEYEQAIFSKLEELQKAEAEVASVVAAPESTQTPTTPNPQTLQWRVASASTLRNYATAVKDFESVTGTKAEQASFITLRQWHDSMIGRKYAQNTIRARLSAVRLMSNCTSYPLPPKIKYPATLLSLKQVRAILAQAKNAGEREALMKALSGFNVVSKHVETDTDFMAHFLGIANNTPTSAQALTRLLKRCAKKAGIEQTVSLRIWAQSGAWLLKVLSPVEFSKLMPIAETLPQNVKPLHGINRRSHLIKS